MLENRKYSYKPHLRINDKIDSRKKSSYLYNKIVVLYNSLIIIFTFIFFYVHFSVHLGYALWTFSALSLSCFLVIIIIFFCFMFQPIKDGELPPYDAVESILPEYQYIFVDPKTGGETDRSTNIKPAPPSRTVNPNTRCDIKSNF